MENIDVKEFNKSIDRLCEKMRDNSEFDVFGICILISSNLGCPFRSKVLTEKFRQHVTKEINELPKYDFLGQPSPYLGAWRFPTPHPHKGGDKGVFLQIRLDWLNSLKK